LDSEAKLIGKTVQGVAHTMSWALENFR